MRRNCWRNWRANDRCTPGLKPAKAASGPGPLENQKDVTPRHIKAEVWMTICRGATAIGYFTHVWKPSYHQFGVPEENRAALREINAQITRLDARDSGRSRGSGRLHPCRHRRQTGRDGQTACRQLVPVCGELRRTRRYPPRPRSPSPDWRRAPRSKCWTRIACCRPRPAAFGTLFRRWASTCTGSRSSSHRFNSNGKNCPPIGWPLGTAGMPASGGSSESERVPSRIALMTVARRGRWLRFSNEPCTVNPW